jgi:hypothetical protein
MMKRELWGAVLQQQGYMLVGSPQWAGGSKQSKSASDTIKIEVTVQGGDPQNYPWNHLSVLGIPSRVITNPDGTIHFSGQMYPVTFTTDPKTAERLKICKSCLVPFNLMAHSQGCKDAPREEARPQAPRKPRGPQYRDLAKQYDAAVQQPTEGTCRDWEQGKLCKKGRACMKQHPKPAPVCFKETKFAIRRMQGDQLPIRPHLRSTR